MTCVSLQPQSRDHQIGIAPNFVEVRNRVASSKHDHRLIPRTIMLSYRFNLEDRNNQHRHPPVTILNFKFSRIIPVSCYLHKYLTWHKVFCKSCAHWARNPRLSSSLLLYKKKKFSSPFHAGKLGKFAGVQFTNFMF